MTLWQTCADRRRRGRIRGQTVVEFALILPVFLMLTVGVVDMARIFSAYVALTNGVREAGIYASFTTTSTANFDRWCSATPNAQDLQCPTKFYDGSTTISGGTTALNKNANPDNLAFRIALEGTGLDPTKITLCAPACADTASGLPVTNAYTCTSASVNVSVRASYQINLLTPIVGTIVGSPLTMSASTTARILRPSPP